MSRPGMGTSISPKSFLRIVLIAPPVDLLISCLCPALELRYIAKNSLSTRFDWGRRMNIEDDARIFLADDLITAAPNHPREERTTSSRSTNDFARESSKSILFNSFSEISILSAILLAWITKVLPVSFHTKAVRKE